MTSQNLVKEVVIMCEICGMNPCHIQCPNSNRKVVATCDECGEEIYVGEPQYTDACGFTYCSKECAIDHNEIREVYKYY